MAHDLLFGKTRRNWSRGSCRASQISDEVTVKLSDAEMNLLADLASTKMLADLGDKKARKKMHAVKKKISVLQKQARRGDPKARRALYVLNETGVFRGVQSFSLGSQTLGSQTLGIFDCPSPGRQGAGKDRGGLLGGDGRSTGAIHGGIARALRPGIPNNSLPGIGGCCRLRKGEAMMDGHLRSLRKEDLTPHVLLY